MPQFDRFLKLPIEQNFFLFGARQSGKSTLIRNSFKQGSAYYYDLLLTEEFTRLSMDPSLLRKEVLVLYETQSKIRHIVIDEVQRVPELLNEVHWLIENTEGITFCLSGSSARKLRKSNANMLGGRAWDLYLYPLTHLELKKNFKLNSVLNYGSLPLIYLTQEDSKENAIKFLRSYVNIYLEEEIKAEALVRNIGSFSRFLKLAAHESGNLVNFSKIAQETANKSTDVKEFFSILEDTLIGFFLYPYTKSERKRLARHPKFYFFDTGVQRAITGKSSLEVEAKTPEYSILFENFIIKEIIHLSTYCNKNYNFYFYKTSGGAEVDLIIETPSNKVYAIEIKSTDNPQLRDLTGLKSFQETCPHAILLCASNVLRARKEKNIMILPWQELFKILFEEIY